MLALAHVEAEEERHRCPVCGGDARDCQNPENQRAYTAHFTRCFATKAVAKATRGRGDDPDSNSLVVSVRHHPDRVRKTE